LDYFSKNVPLIKSSGEKAKALTLMLPVISFSARNYPDNAKDLNGPK
jgi:hypothetical protein